MASLLRWALGGDEAWGQQGPTEGALPAATAARFSLCKGGQVQVWGDNSAGQLGLGTTGGTVAQPTTNPYLTTVVAMASGNQHTVALLANGTVYAWGANSVGQLGQGTTGPANATPQLVPLTCVVALSANGDYTMALKADGTLWSWGDNSSRQLGYGSASIVGFSATPRQVTSGAAVAQVACGPAHCLALLTSGTVLGWGANAFSVFGTPFAQPQPTPINLPRGGVGTIIRLASSQGNSALINASGQVYTWGSNSFGQIGNGTTGGGIANAPVAVALPSGVVVTDLATTSSSVCAITSTGRLLVWGYNGHGELGDPYCASAGTGTAQPTPVPGPPLASAAVAIRSLVDAFLVTQLQGKASAWGSAVNGQLGYPKASAAYSCVATSPRGLCPAVPASLPTLPAVAVSASTTATCAGLPVRLTATGGDGSTYTWSPATGLSATTGSQVVATPTVSTTYTVSSGCGPSVSIALTVEANCCPIDVYTSFGTPVTTIPAGTYATTPFTQGAGAIYYVPGTIHLTQDVSILGPETQVLLGTNAYLLVEDQAELVSVGATFTAACRNVWAGIEMNDQPNPPPSGGIQFTSGYNLQGQLVRSRIEHAMAGISYSLVARSYTPQQTAPYLRVEETDFFNNILWGAYLIKSAEPVELLDVTIQRCRFDCDPTALKTGFGNPYPRNFWYTPRHLILDGDLRNAAFDDNTFSHALIGIQSYTRPWFHLTNSTFNECYFAGIASNFYPKATDRPTTWTTPAGNVLDYEMRLEHNTFNFPSTAQLNTSQADNERSQHNLITSPSYAQTTGVFLDRHDVEAWNNTFQQLHEDSLKWSKYAQVPHLGLYGNRNVHLERNRFTLLGTGIRTNPLDPAFVPQLYDNATVNCRVSHAVGEAAYPQTGTSVATSCNSFVRNEPITPRGGETYGIYVERGMQVQLLNPRASLGTIKNLFDYRTPVSGAFLYVYNDSGNPLDYRTFDLYAPSVQQNSYPSAGGALNVVNAETFDNRTYTNNCAADLFGNGIQQLRAAGKKPGQQPTARLEQNSPNPTTGETVIRYEVAAGTHQAELLVREGWNAKEVLRLPVSVTSQQVRLQVANLPEGMYFYTLLVDGVPVQTKRMVVSHDIR